MPPNSVTRSALGVESTGLSVEGTVGGAAGGMGYIEGVQDHAQVAAVRTLQAGAAVDVAVGVVAHGGAGPSPAPAAALGSAGGGEGAARTGVAAAKPEESEADLVERLAATARAFDSSTGAVGAVAVEELGASVSELGGMVEEWVTQPHGEVRLSASGGAAQAQTARVQRASQRPTQTPVTLRQRATHLALRAHELHETRSAALHLASRLRAKKCSLQVAVNSLEDLRGCLAVVRLEEVGRRVDKFVRTLRQTENVEQLWPSPQRGMQKAVAAEVAGLVGELDAAMADVHTDQMRTRALSRSLFQVEIPDDEALLEELATLAPGELVEASAAGAFGKEARERAQTRLVSPTAPSAAHAEAAAAAEMEPLPDVAGMTLRDMKKVLDAQGVDYSHCIEKSEVRALVQETLGRQAEERGRQRMRAAESQQQPSTLRTASGASIHGIEVAGGLSGMRLSVDAWSGPQSRRQKLRSEIESIPMAAVEETAHDASFYSQDGADGGGERSRARSKSRAFVQGMAKSMKRWRRKGRAESDAEAGPENQDSGGTRAHNIRDKAWDVVTGEAGEGLGDLPPAMIAPKQRWFERRATRQKELDAHAERALGKRRSISMPSLMAEGGLLRYVESRAQQDGAEVSKAAHAKKSQLEYYTRGGSARQLRGGRGSRQPQDQTDADVQRRARAKRIARQSSTVGRTKSGKGGKGASGRARGKGKGKGKGVTSRAARAMEEAAAAAAFKKAAAGPSFAPTSSPAEDQSARDSASDEDSFEAERRSRAQTLRATRALRERVAQIDEGLGHSLERIPSRANMSMRSRRRAIETPAGAAVFLQAVSRGYLARAEYDDFTNRLHGQDGQGGLRLLVYHRNSRSKTQAASLGDAVAELVTLENVKGHMSLTWGGQLKLQVADQRGLWGTSDVHQRVQMHSRRQQGSARHLSARVGGQAQRLRDVHRVVVGVLGGEEASWPVHLEPMSNETRFSLIFDGATGERLLVTMEAASASERLRMVRPPVCLLLPSVTPPPRVLSLPILIRV
eukprot:g5451.t1